MKSHIRKDDTVLVMRGNEKGKKGKILKIDTKKHRVFVEHVNLRTVHVKPTQKNPKGQRRKIEGSIHRSNVMIIDPAIQRPTRTGKRQPHGEKKWQRYSKKTQNPI